MRYKYTWLTAAIILVLVLALVGVVYFPYLSGRKIAHDFHAATVGFSATRNTFRNSISERELMGLFDATLASTRNAPVFYAVEDQIAFPSVLALWQERDKYRTVQIYLGNDNRGIVWQVKYGEYVPRSDWTYSRIDEGWHSHAPF